MFLIPKWIVILCLAGVLPPCCSGVHVFVRDQKRYAVLFQSVVLPCHYTSVSTQTPVVQWVYKSYCHDRTRDAFRFSEGGTSNLGGRTSGRSGGAYETAGYLECSDTSRTVRIVASIAGSSITLSEYYKNRDISIINKADLRIGEVRWGDSGVYICKVVISDDPEGQNEAPVELLVLGFLGVPEDLLPGFELKLMPEWVFVAAVTLGSALFLLLIGVCWCQCCPHSCCCYVSCWCCPDTCCCPRHLYEAGKGIKTGTSTPQTPVYPPYFLSGMPTMVPITPPSLVDKMSSIPASDSTLLTAVAMQPVGVPYRVPSTQDQDSLKVLQYVEKQLAHFNPSRSNSQQSCNQSELSSLHEGENGLRQTFRNIQRKALPTIPDHEPDAKPQRNHDNSSQESQRYHDNPPLLAHCRNEPDSGHRQCHAEPHPAWHYTDDAPSSSQSHKLSHHQRNYSQEENRSRWNSRSEHLQRKTYHTAGRTGSLDELEEFAASYRQRAGRGPKTGQEEREAFEMELQEFSRYPFYQDGPPQYYHNHENDLGDVNHHDDHHRQSKRKEQNISPIPTPKKRRGTCDSEHHDRPPLSSREKDTNDTFLSSLVERKAKLRGATQGKSRVQGEDGSETQSKGSSKKSSESSRHCSRSPSSRPETESLLPSSDAERNRSDRPPLRTAATCTRSSQPAARVLSSHREEPRDKSRKASTLLSRDSLIV